jgi:carboxyl-terminal processing protease
MKRAGGIAAVALLVAGAFLLGFFLTRPAEPAAQTAMPRPELKRPGALVDQVRTALEDEYYRGIDPSVLGEPTVDGILERLGDPHTDYLSPAEFQSIIERTEGTYSGIGLTVGPSRAGLVVTSALRGPARAAGIRKGDIIVRIDGKPAGRLPFERSLALIKGEKGTMVELTVRRPKAGTMRLRVVRQQIDVPPIQTRLLEEGDTKLGYVRIFSFPEGVAGRLERVTGRLVEQGAAGTVVDLRDNPGGLLSEAVAAVSVFLQEGVVCETDGAHQDHESYSVSGDAAYPELPLVVLVDAGSASAAEIVAAALEENGRARLVGDRTFGKASVQAIEPLANGGALKLTTAKYVTPKGVDISRNGLRPKVKAIDDPLTGRDEALGRAQRVALRLIASR